MVPHSLTGGGECVWGILYWNAWSYGHQVPLQPTRPVLSILFLNRRERGSRDGSVGQGACYHTWPPKINAWDPRDGRRELSCHKLASDLHMCSVAHVRQVNKQRCKKKKWRERGYVLCITPCCHPLPLKFNKKAFSEIRHAWLSTARANVITV